ncbi:MAG: RluA family pseudouridine synthase [Planctomycetota bacterium]
MATLSIEANPRIRYRVAHRDEHLLVVEKPARLATTPGKGHDADTLLNGLFHEFGPQLQNVGRSRDFGLMHRLDRMTSGLLIVALSPRVYDAMADQFRERRIAKFYWAITKRAPAKVPTGAISKPILEEQKAKKLARIGSGGKPAFTAYRLLEANHLAALLECRALTGRLHQVRVHLASIGCPILGDDLYANPAVASAASRLMLHAHRLVLEHPETGAQLDVRAPLPKDIAATLKRVGLAKPGEPGSQQGHQVGGDAVGP